MIDATQFAFIEALRDLVTSAQDKQAVPLPDSVAIEADSPDAIQAVVEKLGEIIDYLHNLGMVSVPVPGAELGDDLQDALTKIDRTASKAHNITGSGGITVHHTPMGVHLGFTGAGEPAGGERAATPLEIKWGKATTAWTSGNTVTLDPCDENGTDIGSGTNITAYILMPQAATAPHIEIDQNDVLPYLEFYDIGSSATRAVIIQHQVLPDNAATGALVFNSAQAAGSKLEWVAADADYKVLQRKADDSIGFDYPRWV